MNKALIDLWNETIQPRDRVYVLGDVIMGPRSHYEELLGQLQGRKYLIVGNHDSKHVRNSPVWEEVFTAPTIITQGGHQLVLLHYPMASWPHKGHGSVHLHGHTHGTMDDTRNRIDVGVDCWDYQPVTWDEIDARRKALPEEHRVDHHHYQETPIENASRIPLILMVGPSGAGKSTFLRNMCAEGKIEHTSIISTDSVRAQMFGPEWVKTYNPKDNARVWAFVTAWARARLAAGLPVIIDATHLTVRDRLTSLALVDKRTPVAYWVVNRPLSVKLRDGGWRLNKPKLIEDHEDQFQDQFHFIMSGDNRDNVTVRDFTISEDK